MRSLKVYRTTLATVLFACVSIPSCSDSIVQNQPQSLWQLEVVSGSGQVGKVGAELPAPLVVRALDMQGKPVSGQVINFRVTSGAGSVFAGAATTDASGIAQERWTLGTSVADSQRVEARAVQSGTGAPLRVTFAATARLSVVTRILVQPEASIILGGRRASAHAIVRYHATAFDSAGNSLTDSIFSWAVNDTLLATITSNGTLNGKRMGLVRVSVSLAGVTGSDTLRLVDVPPTIRIISPAPGIYPDTSLLTFVADAVDPDGGVIDSIVWYSTVVGRMGQGTTIQRRLSQATHRILATAYSRNGLTTQAFTILRITRPGALDRDANALRFDGNDLAEVEETPVLDLDSVFTIEAWVKPASGTTAGQLVAKWGSGGHASYALWLNGSVAAGSTHDGTRTTTVFGTGTVTPGIWQHVAFVLIMGQAGST